MESKGKTYITGKMTIQQLIETKEGCLATDRITVDGCPIGFLYRDEPYQNGRPDTGWRFFAGDETEEYIDDLSHSAVWQLNTICNIDPDIIPYLHAPPGSAFIRDETGNFVLDRDWMAICAAERENDER
ncbi:MAG: DUF2185 domain-containing protein [Bacilli bacterium]